jgi:hypothetical protein
MKKIAVHITALLTALQFAFAAPSDVKGNAIIDFLCGAGDGSQPKKELVYNDVKDRYLTRITFTRNNHFRRSDGMHGTWILENGKLILTVLGSSDGTIVFDVSEIKQAQIRGRFPKGKFRAHIVNLKKA